MMVARDAELLLRNRYAQVPGAPENEEGLADTVEEDRDGGQFCPPSRGDWVRVQRTGTPLTSPWVWT